VVFLCFWKKPINQLMKDDNIEISRVNNFDLLRLLASLQVFVYHAINHFNLEGSHSILWQALSLFPGVPIFFFISGFLITASFQRNTDKIGTYFKNRLLRIYPALWVCFIFTLLLLVFCESINFGNSHTWLWIAAQLSFLQFYTPDFLRNFGIGNPNGSLWSIVVELQFYVILPLICIILNKINGIFKKNTFIVLLLICSYTICYSNILFPNNESNTNISLIENTQSVMFEKLFTTSIISNFYFFAIGILFYLNWQYLAKFCKQKAMIWWAVYIIYSMVFAIFNEKYYNSKYDNIYAVIALIIMAFAVFSSAFSMPNLSKKLLKHNDFSYGIYIYHMPIINVLLESNFGTNDQKILISIILVSILAILSWYAVEKPTLKLKT
jgi:peptidoglycan/LPS O-acetylase OafA/YrhL